jgi:hypothetical protein
MGLHRWMLGLTPVLWANVGAMLLLLVTAFILVWQNGNSRNLALALGVLFGAVIAFGVQLLFELQPSTSEDPMAVALIVDRTTPEILLKHHYIRYGRGTGMEAEASAWLAQHKPDAFREHRLIPDFIFFSLIAMLAHEESDWRNKRYTYQSKATPSTSFWVNMFAYDADSWRNDNCTVFTATDFRAKLAQAGNLFADALQELPPGRVCLPPHSTIEISDEAFAIRNLLCEIVFHIAPVIHTVSSAREPPDYVPRYEDQIAGLNVKTTYFALRAHHHESSTYHTWASRAISRAREWFDSE